MKNSFVSFKNALNIVIFGIFIYLLNSLIAKVDAVGGVDFYYYILYGRDLFEKSVTGSMRYGYFPGFYWFWKFCFDLVGKDLHLLQLVYVSVLILSSLLCLACSFVFTKNSQVSLISGCFYIILLYLLEGTAGCIEPIAAFIVLLGFFLYLLLFKKRKFHLSALIFSLFLGINFFLKQQGLFFVVASVFLPFSEIKKFLEFRLINVLVPAGAVLILFILLFLDGGGFEAFKIATSIARSYSASGSFSENLIFYFTTVSPVFWLVFFCILASVSMNLVKNRFFSLGKWEPAEKRIVLFLVASGVFALYQFKVRGYLHYGVYTIPAIAIASAALLARLELRSGALIFASIFTIFFYKKEAWSNIVAHVQAPAKSVIQPDVDRLASVCPNLTSKSVLLLPPRTNSFHWICDTRTALEKWGYSWYEESAEYYKVLILNSGLQNIFVFDKSFGDYERMIWERSEWLSFEDFLLKNNYEITYSVEAGRLYVLKKSPN